MPWESLVIFLEFVSPEMFFGEPYAELRETAQEANTRDGFYLSTKVLRAFALSMA